MAGLYLSRGNVPSTWTHALQGVRMTEALAARLPGFALVTQAHPEVLQGPAFDFEGWYGIRRPFPIVQLPSPDPDLAPQPLIEGWSYPLFDRAAVEHARQVGADFVFTRSSRAACQAIKRGLPTVLEIHVGPTSRHFKRLLRLRRHPCLLGVVTVSELAARGYVRLGLPEEKVLAWPDAVDLETFSDRIDGAEARRELGLPTDRWIAGYCGHLYQGRGLEQILEAAAALPDALFLLVGGTPDKVLTWSDRAGGLSNVRFVGHVPHHRVPAYLRACDALMLPYSASCTTAPWMSPMKLFESMAVGRPIVSTDLPAIARHLESETNSLVIPPDDSAALIVALRRLRSDPELGNRLAARARLDVSELTWDRRAQAIVEAFGLDRLEERQSA